MNTPLKLSKRWLQKGFVFVELLSLAALPLFANEASPSLTLTSQYQVENNYYNTWENSILYDPRFQEMFQWGVGAQLGFSKNDFETIQYKFEPAFLYKKVFETHARLSRKVFLPDTTSFTHTLLYFKFQSPPLLSLRFFTRLGWYYRFWEMNRASIFPLPVNSTHIEYDFALGLGMIYEPEAPYFVKLEAATFDEMEVYNLNHPYAELKAGIWLTDFWSLSTFFRSQFSLGFGRLDRLAIGFTMDFITDRYWD